MILDIFKRVLIVSFIFSLLFFGLYFFYWDNALVISLLFAVIPLVYGIVLSFVVRWRKYNVIGALLFTFITVSIICLLLYIVAFPFQTGETIGYYIFLGPFILFTSLLLPLLIQSYIIMKFAFKK